MNDDLAALSDAFLAAPLPIGPDDMEGAARRAVAFYAQAPARIALPAAEVAGRFSEMWELWRADGGIPSSELRGVVAEAIGVSDEMSKLGGEYFKLLAKLETNVFMGREYALALVGSAPLIRTLVVEQHLGLDRIRSIVNVPGATFEAIRSVLNAIGIPPTFDLEGIRSVYESDVKDASLLFGDTPPDEAGAAFRNLIGTFVNSSAYGKDVQGLVEIGFEPYLFMLYYELLTLESTDRFPGHAVYECVPRSTKVKALWNEMYNPTQENPYLNNAKSVYSLDASWAETKLSRETQNGSLMLADAFAVLAGLPYPMRRRVAHVTRCYLALMANRNRLATPLPAPTPAHVRWFVERICDSNSLTKGVLDQRLVEFLTRCVYDEGAWFSRGLGSSVNESNAAGRKYGDVEYHDIKGGKRICAYEAHGGSLRDEYVEDHMRSLQGTVDYYTTDAASRGEVYEREVEIAYVAHDVSRLERYEDGYATNIRGVPFSFRFITFRQLLEEAGGLDPVSLRTGLFDELIHQRISRLPDISALKSRYCELAGLTSP